MQNEPGRIAVDAARAFKRHLRELSKKYRHIRSDIQPILDAIRSRDFVGDRIPGTEYVVFKVRVRNRDIEKGKRSGYRLIYQVKTPTAVLLVAIYSKLDQADISASRIRTIIIEET